MSVKNQIKSSAGDKMFITGIYLFLSLIFIVIAYPLIYIISASFSSPEAVTSGKVWLLPVDPTLMGYKTVFENPQVLTGFSNSLFYTVVGTLISVALTIMIAYPLSRKTFIGRNVLMFFLIFTMLFEGGLIPLYLVVKSLNMIDSIWAMLLPQALVVWNIIIARTFFQSTIPESLSEAAEIDGCSDLGFVWRVVLPLSKPIIAVLVLMYAVMKWNTYFDALIYLKSDGLFPLQIVLRNILILDTGSEASMMDVEEMLRRQGLKDLMKYSLIVISSIPVLVIYPFAQKHFVKGMMIGSVKG